jgi:excisionase family DNA binding protein
VGRLDEALATAQEAVQVYKRLAAANPAAHEANLAKALNNLGNRLSDVGRLDEALATAQEAVQVYKRLAAANPAAREPSLAMVLYDLEGSLAAQRRAEADSARDERTDGTPRLAVPPASSLLDRPTPTTDVESRESKPRFLTVGEVAAVMRVSKMTVYRLVHYGELEAVRVGRSFRVPESAVNDYLRQAYTRSVMQNGIVSAGPEDLRE